MIWQFQLVILKDVIETSDCVHLTLKYLEFLEFKKKRNWRNFMMIFCLFFVIICSRDIFFQSRNCTRVDFMSVVWFVRGLALVKRRILTSLIWTLFWIHVCPILRIYRSLYKNLNCFLRGCLSLRHLLNNWKIVDEWGQKIMCHRTLASRLVRHLNSISSCYYEQVCGYLIPENKENE